MVIETENEERKELGIRERETHLILRRGLHQPPTPTKHEVKIGLREVVLEFDEPGAALVFFGAGCFL